MPSISESLASGSQIADVLASGVDWLSGSQQITFATYSKSVLSTDGYVFWVNTGQTVTVKGSLHYSIDQQQNEDETNDASRVIFTSLKKIDTFNQAAFDVLYVGTQDGIQFAFNARGDLYQQANLYHYVGYKVPPALASQLVNSADDLPAGPIVSNSLPFWLEQKTIGPVFPSYLVPANTVPPYVTAHVEPSRTEGAHFPVMQWPGDTATDSEDAAPMHSLPVWQMAKDEVRLTLYGFTNRQAMQFYETLVEYSLNTENFGFENTPTIRDEKRVSSELNVLAMKKTLDITAWYYQDAADVVARRQILEALTTTTVKVNPPPG